MVKKEFKDNFKSLILWILVLIVLFTVVYLIYPSIMSSENSHMLKEMLKAFPNEVVKMFNMDISGIDTAFGWFKTEGFMFLLLLGAVYSGILGSIILSKEESEKTIEFLASKSASRTKILFSKISCGLLNITLLYVAVMLFNIVGMKISDNLDIKMLLILSLAPLLTCYVIYLLTMYISMFLKRPKKSFYNRNSVTICGIYNSGNIYHV